MLFTLTIGVVYLPSPGFGVAGYPYGANILALQGRSLKLFYFTD